MGPPKHNPPPGPNPSGSGCTLAPPGGTWALELNSNGLICESPVAIPGMHGWLGHISQAQTGVGACRVRGTQRPTLSHSSSKGIAYIQPCYRCRRPAAGRAEFAGLSFSKRSYDLPVHTHPSAVLPFAEICPSLLTELLMEVGNLRPVGTGHLFGLLLSSWWRW